MIVVVTNRAARAAARIAARWHDHADYPDTFEVEWHEALDKLESPTGIGIAAPTRTRPDLRRLLLPKSRCHAYFEVDAVNAKVVVLHVWDGRRGRRPRL